MAGEEDARLTYINSETIKKTWVTSNFGYER